MLQEGMEADKVRDVASALLGLAGRADGVRDSGTAMLRVLAGVWEGDDLGRFVDRWESARPRLTEAAEGLRRAGEDLHRQVDDQIETSGGEGSGGGGWGWPDLDLPDLDFPDLGNPFEGFGWEMADFAWPDIDWGGLWDGFLDVLESIGDWWDDLPIWAQIVIGIVAAVVIVALLILAGVEIVGIAAIIVAVVAVAGIVMTVLDMADAVAEFLRDPEKFIEKLLEDPLAALEELVWLGIGFLPFGIGKLLQRFRRPIREFLERAAPWIRRKGDEIADWFRRKRDEVERAYERLQDRLTSRRNRERLQGGLEKHESPPGTRGGGHTIDRHVGKSDQDLIDRANGAGGQRRPAGGASSYPDQARAERAIADNLSDPANEQKIQEWLADPDRSRTLALDSRHDYPTGRHVPRDGTVATEVHGSRVVIVADPSMPKGYRILTSHPTP